MTYSKACEILRFTTPKSLAENARLAESFLKHGTIPGKTPIRKLIAADVLIKAAK